MFSSCLFSSAVLAADSGSGDKRKVTPAIRSKAEILANQDLANASVRARVVAELEANEKIRYDAVKSKAKSLGIPERVEGPGKQISILYDFRGDEPIYRKTLNANAAISSAANQLYPAPYSLNGNGITVGVWDEARVRSTHREMTGRVTFGDSTTTLSDHGTHVGGTIAASGVTPAAKGMAPAARVRSFDWNSDYAEMTAAGAATATATNSLPISNHSYGYNATTADMGVYNAEAVSTDSLARGLPYYLIYWAAGNEQDSLTAKGGYQSITYNGLAKNIMTIGAVNDAVSGTNRSLAAATMSTFSSWGPSDDGRIKPDLVANGVSVNSPISTSDSAYDATYSGTSMATPSAAGSSALLMQLYMREFSGRLMLASTLKALLIHTADDLGTTGPDYKFGWGHINVKTAADVILAHKNNPGAPKFIETNITSTLTSRSHTFNWDGTSPIRATLVWTDPAGTARNDNDRTPVLVHNLDLRIIGPTGTVFQPYVMPFSTNHTDANFGTAAIRGSNRVDNVERVDIASPSVPGQYTAVVSLGGSLSGTNAQNYSLVLTGSIGTSLPPQFAPLDPITAVNGRALVFAVSATDPADNNSITLAAANLPAGATFGSTNGNGTFTWGSATPNGVYTPRFTATDIHGTVTQVVTITVVDNAPPTLNLIGDKNTIINSNLVFVISATDPIGNDTITLTASNLPAGATFSSTNGNGTFSWINAGPVGLYPVTFAASDVAGSDTETMYITVKPTPVFIYGSNGTQIVLNDATAATPYPSTITISGVTGVIERVIATLHNFTHEYPADMDILLVGPQGQKTVLMGSAGGTAAVGGLTLSFDDLAESAAGAPIESGTWKPSGSITAAMPGAAPGVPYETNFTNFLGASPNGTWSLYAADAEAPDLGVISNGWSLQVQIITLTNQPPSFTPVGSQLVPIGTSVELAITASDLIDSDSITLSADQLPPGAMFTTVTNSGTVSNTMIWNNASPDGNYNAVFRATDKDGSRTLNVPITVFVPPPAAPASLWASATNNTGFTASWSSVIDADDYRLDVSTNAAFETVSTIGTVTSLFYHSGTPNGGSGGTWTLQNVGGSTYILMTSNASRVISPTVLYNAGVTNALTFRARTFGGVNATSNTITVSISTNGGTSWTVLGTRTPLSSTMNAVAPFDISAYDGKLVTVKFETLGAGGGVGAGIQQMELDALYYEVVPSFVVGYSNRTTATTTEIVTGLSPNTPHYFRVRAVNGGGQSSNSTTASVSTTFIPEPPVFTSGTGPYSTTTGVQIVFSVAASGIPSPTLSLAETTASGGYAFTATNGALTYTPPVADVGTRTFTFTAANASGIATQIVTVIVAQGRPHAPATIWASETNTTDFTASWTAVDGATSYQVDVATNSFLSGTGVATNLLSESFASFTATNFPAGWTSSRSNDLIYSSLPLFGAATPAFKFQTTGQLLITPAFSAGATNLVFWAYGNGNSGSTLAISGLVNSAWTLINTVTIASSNGTYNVTLNPQTTQIGFYFTKVANVALDDLFVQGGGSSVGFVSGYSNLVVSGTSQIVSGLTQNTAYFFRARALNDAGTSSNSPTATVITRMANAPPVFGSNPGPVSAVVGVQTSFTVTASGFPPPAITLQNQTASSGFSFGTEVLTYTPPAEDVGSRTFTFVASNSVGLATQVVSVTISTGGGGQPGVFTNIYFQGFESGDNWIIISGTNQISSATGASDFPPNQRIRSGSNSWQVSNLNRTLELASVSLSGFTGRYVTARVSSTSTSGSNGAEAADFIRVFAALNGSPFSVNPDIHMGGNTNIRFGYWATNILSTTAGTTVSNISPVASATTSNAYATLRIHLPESATSVALRVSAINNDTVERWNIDDIAVDGYAVASGNSDSNSDGVPDSWFSQNGLNPTNSASAEIPAGGATYLEAYMHDINPNAPLPTNFNRAMPMGTNAAGPIMVFVVNPSSTGRMYDVLAADDLMNTNWIGFGLNVRGNGGALNLIVTNQLDERFYRTGVKMP